MSSSGSLALKNKKGSRLAVSPSWEPYGPTGSTDAPVDLNVIHRLFGRGLHRYYGDISAALGFGTVSHATVDEGKQRVNQSASHSFGRMPFGPVLSYDDVAGTTRLAAEQLDAETLARRIAAVARRSASFLVRHGDLPSSSSLARFHDGFMASCPLVCGEGKQGLNRKSGRRLRRSRLGFRHRLPPWPGRRRLRRLVALGQDLGDPNQREFLAMPALAPRILAASLLEGNDLRAAHMIQHLSANCGTRHRGGAKRGFVATNHQNFSKFHNRAGLGFEPVDPEHVRGDDAILLAARFDDREHLFGPCVRVRCSDQ